MTKSTDIGATTLSGINDTENGMSTQTTTDVIIGAFNDSPKSHVNNEEHAFIPFPRHGTDTEAMRAYFEALLKSAPTFSLEGSSQVGESMLLLLTDGDPLCKGCVPSRLDVNPYFNPDNAFVPFGDDNIYRHEVSHLDIDADQSRKLYGHPYGYQGFAGGNSLGQLLDRLRSSEGPFALIGLDNDIDLPNHPQKDGSDTSSK
jgi:hypothetical protein